MTTCGKCRRMVPPVIHTGVREGLAQYGTGIQTLATYLVEGQSVPYARASQLLQELLGVLLSAGSIATFVKTCHRQLAEVETSLKAAFVKAKVIHQDETRLRVGKSGMIHGQKITMGKRRAPIAIGPKGQYEFYVQSHTIDDYRTCDVCPHDVVE